MKTFLDCYSCFVRQALDAARMAGADEAQQKTVLVEEPEALAKFGEAYLEYQRRVPMFNLHLDCLRHLFRRSEF